MRLALVAGEASGDLLASLMLRGLRDRWPALHSGGIGGPRMVQEGFEVWAPSERLSVFGYLEAIKRLPELLWLRRRTRQRILRERPDAFVGVDAPDFNFGLETHLRRKGVPTVHFVCPSIWAWRPDRVQRLKAAADHVLCLFPFEPALLASHGVAATYVGHPLADEIPLAVDRAAARRLIEARMGSGDSSAVVGGIGSRGMATHAGGDRGETMWSSASGVVALLPGSRQAEIRHIAPILVASAQQMLAQRPGLRFLLPVAPGLRPLLAPLVAPLVHGGHLTLLDGHSHEVMAAADVALVASGTATLEAALLKCPMVIVYRLAQADWQRMRRMRLQPWVGLPNVLSREFIVPERLQEEAQPSVVAADALTWLDDAVAVDRYRLRCDELHRELRQNTGLRAAQALQEVLGG